MAESDLKKGRRDKLDEIKKAGINPYPNFYQVDIKASGIKENFADLEKSQKKIRTAGRLMLVRMHGKAGFAHIKDETGMIQIYVKLDFVGENGFDLFKKLDIGDIIGVEGVVFKTHTEEITVKVEALDLLSKSLLPLPEKWHGLQDVEIRYRQRYLDLIMNDDVKKNFQTRSRTIHLIRMFLIERGFLEVETPMMQPVYGGAYARPFTTHHNTLDLDLYLRIAPELYLKRLITGGLDKVFELNRNFRNEGISTRHNPEFTMLELYQAYADYNVMMDLCEDLVNFVISQIKGSLTVEYQDQKLDFKKPWKRLAFLEAIKESTGIDFTKIKDAKQASEQAKGIGIEVQKGMSKWEIAQSIFEGKVEENLIQPVFIIDYPKELSPLAKGKKEDPELVERFEPYIAAREIGNAFSELNDPDEQARRFKEQVEKRKKGNLEAHPMDEDYITALQYGMPPTGGLGVGIDRLIMILINTNSIRDTILFPLLKPVK